MAVWPSKKGAREVEPFILLANAAKTPVRVIVRSAGSICVTWVFALRRPRLDCLVGGGGTGTCLIAARSRFVSGTERLSCAKSRTREERWMR